MESTIDIKITAPVHIHNEIEEYCINNGMNLSQYFLSLHDTSKLNRKEHEEKAGKWEPENELAATSTTETHDKFMKKKTGKK